MREASGEDAKRRFIDQRTRGRTGSGSRDADRQTRALGTVARATRNAAGAQLQPVASAHAHGAPGSGLDDEFDIGEDLVAVPFYLDQRGHGPCARHRQRHRARRRRDAFGGGMRFGAARPGESIPTAVPDATRGNLTLRPARDRSAGKPSRTSERSREPVYQCRFSDVFGERFETLNSPDPRAS